MYILYGIATALLYWWFGGATLTIMSGLIASITAFVWLIWMPSWGRLIPALHKAELKTSPRLLSLIHLDCLLRWNSALVGGWSFLSLSVALLPFMTQTLPEWIYHACNTFWFLLSGILFEWLNRQYSRTASLLDPFKALARIKKEALKTKGAPSDASIERWSEVLEEITARSLDKNSTALAGASFETLSAITEGYIQNNASRLSPSAPEESQHAARYILHNVLEKYADLYRRASQEGHHGLCEQILVGCGKLAIVAAEKNPILASDPIEKIGQLSLENMERDPRDLGLKNTRLLMQIAKRIASHKHTDGASVEKPFLTLLSHLENIAKESFRKNKETPIPLLSDPFKEIKTLFTEGACATYPGSEAILQKNEQVLSDFINLELILRTLPTLSQATDVEGQTQTEKPSSQGVQDKPAPV